MAGAHLALVACVSRAMLRRAGSCCWKWSGIAAEAFGVAQRPPPSLSLEFATANHRQLLPAAAGEAGMGMVAAARKLFSIAVLFAKSRKMRGVHGTFNPSIWRWYHRHGYWAT